MPEQIINDRKSEPAFTGWKLGLPLALTSALFWGLLPIALTIALGGLDPYTITWFRFTVAALALGSMLLVARRLPALTSLGVHTWILLLIALGGLTGNYVLFLLGLAHSSPTISQILAQLSSIFLLLGGLLIFKEHFSALQWFGFALLLLGLLLFFNHRQAELLHLSAGLGLGVAFGVLSALVWSAYGLSQKGLLRQLGSQQVLFLLYLGAAIVLFPIATPAAIRHVNALQFEMLIFCSLNTLIAYGAFAESLKHWQVSRVGAAIATAPLFTVASMWVVERFMPHLVPPERLNAGNIAGALLVVAGSATCALARPK